MTPAHKLMSRDGAPRALFLTHDQRARTWAGWTPPPATAFIQTKPRNEDAETAAFRAAEEERRRQKSLASITRMKNRFASKSIDHSTMRWDPRRCKFVPDLGSRVTEFAPAVKASVRSSAAPGKGETTPAGADMDWSRVNKDNARDLLLLNKVWHEKHDKLKGGLLVMTTTNLLKGLVKRGGTVRWT